MMTQTVIYYMSINFTESLWIQGQTLIVTSYTLCDTMAIFNDYGGSGTTCLRLVVFLFFLHLIMNEIFVI
jgi:hypothetical protein